MTPTPTIDSMVADGMALAKALARRCRQQGVDDDDLESEAMLALTMAAQRYEAGPYDRRTFRQWAEMWIIRALRKLVREAPFLRVAGIPVRMKRAAAKVSAAVQCLAARGIKRPSVEQIAGESLLSVETIELVQTIPGVVVIQTSLEWVESRATERRGDEPGLMPIFGPQPGWTPLTTCAVVHTAERPIVKGSLICCMVCHTSGMDGHPALRRNKGTDPKPEPKRSESPDVIPLRKKVLTRREKRRRLFPPQLQATGT